MSEIHAIDFRGTRFNNSDNTSAHLGLRWDSIAKNHLESAKRTVSHPPLSSIPSSADMEDLSLVPVSALHIYLRKMSSRRLKLRRLFIPLTRNATAEVSRSTISWMTAVILRAYRDAGLDPPSASNAHEVSALASTLALHGTCSIRVKIDGCFLKLANHYLREFATEGIAGIRQFGPC